MKTGKIIIRIEGGNAEIEGRNMDTVQLVAAGASLIALGGKELLEAGETLEKVQRMVRGLTDEIAFLLPKEQGREEESHGGKETFGL